MSLVRSFAARSLLAAALLALAALALPPAAGAEIAFSIASGWAGTPEVDVDLELPSGATVAGDEDGGAWAVVDLRLMRWSPASSWGVGLAASLASDAVTVFDGDVRLVPGQPAPSTIVDAELHQVTIQLLRRWSGTGAIGDPLQVHAGIGAGVVAGRLDGRLATLEVDRWEVSPTVEAIFGVESQLFEGVGVLLEGRVGWAQVDFALPADTRLEGDVIIGRVLLGIVLREGRR